MSTLTYANSCTVLNAELSEEAIKVFIRFEEDFIGATIWEESRRNAFYQSDRANIRSRPRLMVKSGQQARIDVGNEIPFITSTSQSTENPDAPVIQTVSYRKTGVIMQIEPVVHSSGYVDIRITQELSEAQQTSTSAIDSPTSAKTGPPRSSGSKINVSGPDSPSELAERRSDSSSAYFFIDSPRMYSQRF